MVVACAHKTTPFHVSISISGVSISTYVACAQQNAPFHISISTCGACAQKTRIGQAGRERARERGERQQVTSPSRERERGMHTPGTSANAPTRAIPGRVFSNYVGCSESAREREGCIDKLAAKEASLSENAPTEKRVSPGRAGGGLQGYLAHKKLPTL